MGNQSKPRILSEAMLGEFAHQIYWLQLQVVENQRTYEAVTKDLCFKLSFVKDQVATLEGELLQQSVNSSRSVARQ